MSKKLLVIGFCFLLLTVLLSGCTNKTCTICNGTGKCPWCDGSGWAVDWDLECDHCDGTGVCPNCHGSGEISAVPGFEGAYVLVAISILIGILLFRRRKA